MLKSILITIAVAIFSALLVLYAYDIAHGNEIPSSSTRQGIQDLIVFFSKILGVAGSWIVALLAIGISSYCTFQQYKYVKKK